MAKLLRYIFILLVIAIATGYEVSAQATNLKQTNDNRPALQPAGRARANGKKIEAARDKFLAQQLDLTDEEAKAFWPLYHTYQEELKAVRILKRLNSTSSSTGAAQIDKELYYDNQMLTIKRKYLDEFLKIVPSSKISILYKSERAFNDEVIKQLSERSIRAGN
ncbi:hypothetical protein [Mucilaginibacter psychrotolerans]|uniref:Sensor of ECF-type sigma factor n=1 Tax=Mucilaginibacter psychrotolerans TaxID=1524096 RepID=A0A4Y8S8W4_9SPHI|nr:hypothetical protein [Mucilaginibacter psychrotolerans]TFF35055.1 hypothetical protein E2R66_20135 [Mucilaginibacter psychrotolerans]